MNSRRMCAEAGGRGEKARTCAAADPQAGWPDAAPERAHPFLLHHVAGDSNHASAQRPRRHAWAKLKAERKQAAERCGRRQ